MSSLVLFFDDRFGVMGSFPLRSSNIAVIDFGGFWLGHLAMMIRKKGTKGGALQNRYMDSAYGIHSSDLQQLLRWTATATSQAIPPVLISV